MSLLNRQQIADLLGQCPKTILKMIREDGLPMARIGREWKGVREDVYSWIRNQYPQKYKDAMVRSGETTTTTRTRGQLNMEAYGVVEGKGGKRRVVEGAEYIKFTRGDIDGESLVATHHRGNCSFEQTIREPSI